MLHDTLKELKKLTNLDIPDNLTVALSDELDLDLNTIIAFRKHSAASYNKILTEH